MVISNRWFQVVVMLGCMNHVENLQGMLGERNDEETKSPKKNQIVKDFIAKYKKPKKNDME